MTKIVSSRGYEVWTQFDRTAQVYELFASEDASDYIGCADSIGEARQIGKEWIEERVGA